MALSRKTKARILGRLSPWFLVKTSMVLLVLVLVLQVVSLVSLMFENPFPQFSYGLLFIPLVCIQFFRWWAIGQGWSAVCVNELTATSLKEQLMGESGPDLPLQIQSALVKKAHQLGWLSWADVVETARAAGHPEAKLHISVFLGGYRSRIARASDWAKAVAPNAWRGGRMDLIMPEASLSAPRARF